MTLDINGYNPTFKAFTDFAEKKVETGQKKAVARCTVDSGSLAGRTITAATTDKAYAFIRSSDDKAANDATRKIFKEAIIDMFGGESKIPPSVKKAMVLADYDRGKPLTARRILAVKNAIDATGIMRQRAFDERVSQFQSPATKEAAIAKGYSEAELPKLARATNLYAETMHCSEAEALEAVTTPRSKANRLMNYGGRFLQNAENFRNGLRLLEAYDTWFDETETELRRISLGKLYQDGMSMTLLNGDDTAIVALDKRGIEKFVFEEIANNPSIDLAETDNEKVFGMENNPAMRFLARRYHLGRSQTLAQIPPEKRMLLFKAVDVFCPLYASNAAEAKTSFLKRKALTKEQVGYVIARLLKNFDQVEDLQKHGKLTMTNLVKLCFPEIRKPGKDQLGALLNLFEQWYQDTHINPETDEPSKYPMVLSGLMQMTMEATGCTIEEAFEVVSGNKQLPDVQYYSAGTLPINSFDGTTTAARAQLKLDLDRPANYSFGNENGLLQDADAGFRFNFPSGESLVANGTDDGKAAIPTIIDKLNTLCGETHPQQASSVMMMTSQSGLASLRGGLAPYGISSNEHSVIDFTLSKNDLTGDVTIRYSSPKKLPFTFEWTATIRPDGYVTTTPFRFMDENTVNAEVSSAADKIKTAIRKANSPVDVQDKAVLALLESAKTDQDLLALLQADNCRVAKGLLLDVSNQIRSEESVAKRLEALRGSINELRAATSGDKRMFDAGLKQLAMFNGKAIKGGLITKMCDAARKVDIQGLKGIDATSSATRLFGAMCQLDKGVTEICFESKIMENLGDEVGGGEVSAVNSFAMGLIFSRCDDATLRGLKDGLYSENSGKVMHALGSIGEGSIPAGTAQPRNVLAAISRVADSLAGNFRMDSVAVLNQTLGIEEFDLPPFADEANPIDNAGFKSVFTAIESHTLQVHKDIVDN